MSLQRKLPDDDPAIVAWKTYQASEEYKNTARWAANPIHTTGSLWDAFLAGRESLPAEQQARKPMKEDRIPIFFALALVAGVVLAIAVAGWW